MNVCFHNEIKWWLTGVSLANRFHDVLQGGNSVEKCNYEELVAELKTFKEKVIEIEQELKSKFTS